MCFFGHINNTILYQISVQKHIQSMLVSKQLYKYLWIKMWNHKCCWPNEADHLSTSHTSSKRKNVLAISNLLTQRILWRSSQIPMVLISVLSWFLTVCQSVTQKKQLLIVSPHYQLSKNLNWLHYFWRLHYSTCR